jgi:putative transposase
VAQDDHGQAMIVLRRRTPKAATQFWRKRLKGLTYVSRVIITAKWQSDGAAQRERIPGGEPHQRRSRNNRCEHSHRPTRQQERRRQGLKAAGQAQRFRSAYGPLAHPCRPRRHLLSASRAELRKRVARWADMTGTERAAYRVGRSGERHP